MAVVKTCNFAARLGRLLGCSHTTALRSRYSPSLLRHCTTASEREKPDSTTDTSQSSIKDSDSTVSSEIEKLNAELSKTEERCTILDDKYKRSLAEMENLRKRLTKQIDDAKLYGIQGFCKDLLEVADVLNKATESVPPEMLTDKNLHLKNLFEGLQMTEGQLLKVFQRHGLSQINPLGEKFDPNFHEALFEQIVEGKEKGTVVVVTQIGYKLHERTVRPALVGVAKE